MFFNHLSYILNFYENTFYIKMSDIIIMLFLRNRTYRQYL